MKFNSTYAITISSWLLFILILLTEFSAGFKTFLTTILWHHWIAKTIIITLVYCIIGYTIREQPKHERQAWISIQAVIILILALYLIIYGVEA